MTKEELVALLGRPLTSIEDENFDLYLDIATESLEDLLCMSVADQTGSGEPTATEQMFKSREGYSTVFTGIFTEIESVTVDGNAVSSDDYYPAFFDNRNGTFYNSIVFENRCNDSSDDVVISAIWGFETLPNDLARLLAQLFADTSKSYSPSSGNIKSKKTEDFSITYGDLTTDQVFMNTNSRTISKYGMCDIGYIRHGKVCSHGRYCIYCI